MKSTKFKQLGEILKPLLILGTSSIFCLLSFVAFAGDSAAGKEKASTCFGCHGSTGISIAPNFPNLAGQKEAYLAKAIRAYQSGERSDPTMKAMVGSLSNADIDNIAAYFSGLPGK